MTYEALLQDAWRRIKAPREVGAPTVVSVFAGGGGSSMGYKFAGYDVRAAVEWAPYPAACYRHNFPETHMIGGDIAKVGADDLLSITGLRPGELDVLDGSPPCQGFSTIGKRRLTDPRNSLFKEYTRLLRGLKPRAFVMENVSGMVKGRMLWVFREILAALKACGYKVVCRILNAADYKVPQVRQRVIFIGVREDLAAGVDLRHPEPYQGKRTTLQDALPELQGLYIASTRLMASYIRPDYLTTFKKFKPTDQGRTLGKSPSLMLTRVTTVPSRVSQEYPAPGLPDKNIDFVRGLIANSSKDDGVWGATSCQLVIKRVGVLRSIKLIPSIDYRGLSIGEAKRLSSFPDSYTFPLPGSLQKTWTAAWGVLGNSVPPLLCAAVAAHIRDVILAPPSLAAVGALSAERDLT